MIVVSSLGVHTPFFFGTTIQNRKNIDHSPTCCIPLMPVNEHDDKFTFFLSSYSERFIDNEHEEKENNETMNGNIGVDQQSTTPTPLPSPNIFIKESTIKSTIDGKKVICIVVDKFNTTTGLQRYKIRPLYGTKINIVASKDLEHIDPEPADIPLTANDVDTK